MEIIEIQNFALVWWPDVIILAGSFSNSNPLEHKPSKIFIQNQMKFDFEENTFQMVWFGENQFAAQILKISWILILVILNLMIRHQVYGEHKLFLGQGKRLI